MLTIRSLRRENSKTSSLARAFSLTELLVVIGIIVLLIGLLLVALGQVQAKAKETRTLSTMQQFANGCESFHAEHGNYPGVIPEYVIKEDESGGDPKISSTENALLHLMGGYRVLSPADDGTPDSPAELEYTAFEAAASTTASARVMEFLNGYTSGGWSLVVNVRKIGDGPMIKGKPHASYFTPGLGDVGSVSGQVADPPEDSKDEESDVVPLPELLDAWGQPIIYIRRVRDRGPLVPSIINDVASSRMSQFALAGVRSYSEANSCGGLYSSQDPSDPTSARSIFNSTSDDLMVSNIWATVLAHPAFYDPASPASGSPRGSIMLLSSGPDGIYFSTHDGPGSPTDPIDESDDITIDDSVIDAGPEVFGEFDDIRLFGGS